MVQFADSSFEPHSWFWDFGDGFYSDLQNPEHNFGEFGTYYVCETVSNACEVQTYCDSVVVIANGIAQGRQSEMLNLYPNPAKDNVYLYPLVRKNTVVDIELFTLQNSPVHAWTLQASPSAGPVVLNLTGFPKGLYFLRTKIDGHEQVNKLVIQ